MAYLGTAMTQAAAQSRPTDFDVRLGDCERRVIIAARRDALLGRAGRPLADARLEALRRYVMLDHRTGDAVQRLLEANFSPTERRIVDAMMGILPVRLRRGRPVTDRLVMATAILVPVLVSIGAYGWSSLYLQDRLIALVLSGLAMLLMMPLAAALASPATRRNPVQPRK